MKQTIAIVKIINIRHYPIFDILPISVHNDGIEVLDNRLTEYERFVSDPGVKEYSHETLVSESQLNDEVLFERTSSILKKHDKSDENWYQANLFSFQ